MIEDSVSNSRTAYFTLSTIDVHAAFTIMTGQCRVAAARQAYAKLILTRAFGAGSNSLVAANCFQASSRSTCRPTSICNMIVCLTVHHFPPRYCLLASTIRPVWTF